MFKRVKQLFCKHDYEYVGEGEIFTSFGLFPQIFKRVDIVCIKCEKDMKVKPREWKMMQKRKEVLSSKGKDTYERKKEKDKLDDDEWNNF